MGFKQFLLEKREKDYKFAEVVNASIKAYGKLPDDCKRFIDEWETSNWSKGELEQAFKEHSLCYGEIVKAFHPVKTLLKDQFGDSIRLFRGTKNNRNSSDNDRMLFSWTYDENLAKEFAYGVGKFHDIPSDEDIEQAVQQYEQTGFVKFGNYKYKRLSDNPKYFGIYSKNNRFITDSDDLRKTLLRNRKTDKESNDDRLNKGTVHLTDVNIDDIVWITNRLGSKEFIVLLNPHS